MKYIANPVVADASVISQVSPMRADGAYNIHFIDDQGIEQFRVVDAAMVSRMVPQPGDYLVTQGDGYTYLNPKEVFERKYRRYISADYHDVLLKERNDLLRESVDFQRRQLKLSQESYALQQLQYIRLFHLDEEEINAGIQHPGSPGGPSESSESGSSEASAPSQGVDHRNLPASPGPGSQ